MVYVVVYIMVSTVLYMREREEEVIRPRLKRDKYRSTLTLFLSSIYTLHLQKNTWHTPVARRPAFSRIEFLFCIETALYIYYYTYISILYFYHQPAKPRGGTRFT